jgi:ketosteroid isomerase-like protein
MTSTVTIASSVELVQSLFEAFGRGDVPTILSRLSPDCEWINAGEGIPAAGSYTGPAGAAEFFRKLGESEEVTRFEPKEFFTSGDDVVAYGYEECRIRSNGHQVSTNWMMLFRVRAGMVTRFESFYNTAAYALAHRG